MRTIFSAGAADESPLNSYWRDKGESEGGKKTRLCVQKTQKKREEEGDESSNLDYLDVVFP